VTTLVWASVFGNVCRHVPRDIAVRRSIYLLLLLRGSNSKRDTCFGRYSDVDGHVTILVVSY